MNTKSTASCHHPHGTGCASESCHRPGAPVFAIDASTLYSREALSKALAGIVDLDRFLMRLGPRKVFKSAYWGGDLIRAMEQAGEIGEGEPEPGQAGAQDVDVVEIGQASRSKAHSVDRYPMGVEPLDPNAID